MSDLTPKLRKLLREALCSSYRKPETLKRFVSDNFESVQLDSIDFSNALQTVADELISDFEEQGDVPDLIRTLIITRPRNQKVQDLRQEAQSILNLSPQPSIDLLLESVAPDRLIEGQGTCPNSIVVRDAIEAEELIEPSNYAHLVVPIFWEGESKLRKFRVYPKLCYLDHDTKRVVNKPLENEEDIDKYSFRQDEIPEFLEKCHASGIMELRRLFPGREKSWRLSIELFLPVELLCLPLAAWCGQDGEFFSKHPIVVGCSDRFDPLRPAKAIELHNQLQMGWERFRRKVPDKVGSSLLNLEWLDSKKAGQKSLAAYAGFRCYGNWLVPGEWEKLDSVSQKRWKDLVGFGIPLALWICQGELTAPARGKVFKRLASGTRFELLEQIPIIRDEQWKTSGHCVGVFYEDLNYVPKPSGSYFSFPGSESA